MDWPRHPITSQVPTPFHLTLPFAYKLISSGNIVLPLPLLFSRCVVARNISSIFFYILMNCQYPLITRKQERKVNTPNTPPLEVFFVTPYGIAPVWVEFDRGKGRARPQAFICSAANPSCSVPSGGEIAPPNYVHLGGKVTLLLPNRRRRPDVSDIFPPVRYRLTRYYQRLIVHTFLRIHLYPSI